MREIREGGELKGFLASQFYSKPFPFHYLKFTEVSPQDFNKRMGSKMVAEFTDTLKNEKACGILFNSIEGPAREIYKKAGWVELSIYPGWFVYNLPPDLDQTKLDEAIMTLQVT
jgi:hypothetical protein